MMSDVSIRSMLKNGDYGEDLGMLIREKRRQEVTSDREQDLSPYRSGSAPPTVEGSFSAVGGILDASVITGIQRGGGKRFVTEEELRADPAYGNYYYTNVNLNPRLPPPLLSKEDWRFAQRLHSSGGRGGGPVVGGIGDRRKVNRVGGVERSNMNKSLFSVQPGFGGEENGVEQKRGGAAEWGGDGLIGLPGLGLGSRQKSIAEIIQDDISQSTSVSRHPSRPASRNAIDSVETSDAQLFHLPHELASLDALRSGVNKKGMPMVQNIGGLASHTYASALGVSLSRSTTPDSQFVARDPSPQIFAGGEGAGTMNKRSINGPNSFNGASSGINDSSDLMAALSGLNVSKNGMADGENHSQSQILHQLDNRSSQSVKGSYPNNGTRSGLEMDLKTSSVMADNHVELKKATIASANAYLKGSTSPNLNVGGSSPSPYQNMENMNSTISNYGLSGYAINPGSPSMVGSQLASGNVPSLYDNAAAASAIGMTSMDSRAFGGGLFVGPNLLAASVERQNLSRAGNHTVGSALQVPLMDPMYLQYMASNEYAAAQLAALNESTVDREYMANSYMDLLELQKAYLGTLISPQNSQYGAPYLSKSGSLNHGYYGNPAFGLSMSYPGSPLAGQFLPNSPVGSGSPGRHNERNLRFSSGVRNLAGGIMGAWHPAAGGNLDESFGSSLLDEFKSNKTRCFELSEIAGHVVQFSADQYGSRFIQQKLETASTEEKNMVFHEIMPQALSLMTDVFGNYVIQKFFENGTTSQIRELADQLIGHVLTLSLQMYGCRVIQKAIEVVDLDQQTRVVTELNGHIMRCVRDQNGNHVIQKCIECIPEDAIQFIISTFYDQVVTLSTHPYGCRVIQRVLEHCNDPKTQRIMMDTIFQSVCMLAQDQYGNYVVQHVLEHGKPDERSAIIKKLTGQIVLMSQQKFASNVIEKCLSFGTPTERQALVTEMLGSTDENEPLQVMMKDQFANYVVQKVLETCDDQQLEIILNRIKVHLNALKKYTYGKHIVARVEKLVAAGERRISIQTHLHPPAIA